MACARPVGMETILDTPETKEFHYGGHPCGPGLSRKTETTMQRYKSSPSLLGNSIELEDRYHQLREQHQKLRCEANEARDQIRQLNARLSRLLAEKKRFHRCNVKSEREVVLEEKIYQLECQLANRERQNERLHERLQLLRVCSAGGTGGGRPSRSSSAHSAVPVRSRTDSGLAFYFRPLRLQPATAKRDVRSRSVKFREMTDADTDANDDGDDPSTVTTAAVLMQEAKREILRLESLVQQQQREIEAGRSYTITTSMTTTTATTTTAADGPVTAGDEELESLWSQYQQIVLRQESYQTVSAEVKQLIEGLYRALKQERARAEQLKSKLAFVSPPNSEVLQEKDRVVEALRKENDILQNSLKQLQSMMVAEGAEPTGWNEMRAKYQRQIETLNRRMAEMEETLHRMRLENESLRLKYENLQQLNDSDQLKVEHLEEKVKRLSQILFSESGSKDQQLKLTTSSMALNGHHHRQDQDQDQENDLDGQLDQILSTLNIDRS